MSVVIVSYNSAEYILETLDSIFAQTYTNIELIVSDDASTDQTVALAEEWIQAHASRFVNVQLIKSEHNTGIAPNCNRGLRRCKGEYIKLLAADDLLRVNCVEDMLQGIVAQQGDIAFCYEYVFYPKDYGKLGSQAEQQLEVRPHAIGIYKCAPLSMYKRILAANQFPAPTAFYKRDCIVSLDYFDERYPYTEDYPFWIKALQNNAKIVFVETYGVYYRKTESSISWRDSPILSDSQRKFQDCLRSFIMEVRNPEMKRLGIVPVTPKQTSFKDTLSPWGQKVFNWNQALFDLKCPLIIRFWIMLLAPQIIIKKLFHKIEPVFQLQTWKRKIDALLNKIRAKCYLKKRTPFNMFLLKLIKMYDFRYCVPMADDPESNSHWFAQYWLTEKHERAYKKYIQKKTSGAKRILFAVHLPSAFSAIESIYLAAIENDALDVTLLLLPGRQPGMDNRLSYIEGLIEYMEEKKYPYVLGYENGMWHDPFEFFPDCIMYQTPYFTQRHPAYNFKFSKVCPKIIYTPYGPWVMDRSVKDFIDTGIDKPYFNDLWRFFCDKLTYELLDYASPEYLPISIESGSPKVDFHRLNIISGEYCWKEGKDRYKIIWMPRWGVMRGRSSFPDYYQYFLDEIIPRKDVSFVMRPHPLLFKDIRRSKYYSPRKIEEIKSAFELPDNTCIDYSEDYREGIVSCDFIVADFSSVMYEFLPTGKPIIYTKKDNTMVDPRIMKACYVVSNLEELRQAMDMLLQGEDPLYIVRKNVIKELNYFPHEATSNGHFIAQYLAENL